MRQFLLPVIHAFSSFYSLTRNQFPVRKCHIFVLNRYEYFLCCFRIWRINGWKPYRTRFRFSLRPNLRHLSILSSFRVNKKQSFIRCNCITSSCFSLVWFCQIINNNRVRLSLGVHLVQLNVEHIIDVRELQGASVHLN